MKHYNSHHYRNNKLHRKVKEKRGYRCQICGIVPDDLQRRFYTGAVPEPLRNRDFWVHHIDDDPWNDEINNLIGNPEYDKVETPSGVKKNV